MLIEMYNCQAIQSATIDIPPNSIVEFTGDNSNGKSTLSRLLEHITLCDLHLAAHRNPLIMDGEERAVVRITNDRGNIIVLVLYRENGKSQLAYFSDKDSQPYIAMLSDRDACRKIVEKFGFRTYSNGEVCLNLAPTFGAIPLVTTSSKTNFEIIRDFSSDRIADEFLSAYKQYTRPTFNARLNMLKARRDSLESLVESEPYPNWEFCGEFAERVKDLTEGLRRCVILTPIDYARPLPYIDVHMELIGYKRPCVNVYSELADMVTPLKEVISYNNKKCPTCGRNLLED